MNLQTVMPCVVKAECDGELRSYTVGFVSPPAPVSTLDGKSIYYSPIGLLTMDGSGDFEVIVDGSQPELQLELLQGGYAELPYVEEESEEFFSWLENNPIYYDSAKKAFHTRLQEEKGVRGLLNRFLWRVL